MKQICLLLAGLVLAGCSGLPTAPAPINSKPLYSYRPDMTIAVDGKQFTGMAVTALGSKSIQVNSPAAMDALTISSCSRAFKVEKVDEGWFGGSGHAFTYQYNPTPIESDGFCPLYIRVFDSSGTTDWGYVAFRTDQKNLPAWVDCGEQHIQWAGISVCAVQSGMREQITFSKPVNYQADSLCKVEPKDNKTFVVSTTAVGFCYVSFSDGQNFHDLILLGWDQDHLRSQ